MEPSIFLDFHLPNAATWFYFSLFLAVALFFQFTRAYSIRNLDLLTLFLLVPGFLLIQEARAERRRQRRTRQSRIDVRLCLAHGRVGSSGLRGRSST